MTKILVVLILLIVGASYALPRLLSLDTHKPQIISALNKSTMLNFDIEGEINFSLLPRPQLTLGEVTATIAEAADQAPTIKVREMAVSLSLGALFNLNSEWKPSKLVIIDADFDYPGIMAHWQQLKQNKDLLMAPEIQLKNSTVHDYSDGYSIKSLNAYINKSGLLNSSGFAITADCEFKDDHYSMEGSTSNLGQDQISNVAFTISNDKNTLSLKGEAKELLTTPSFKGSASLNFKDASASLTNAHHKTSSNKSKPMTLKISSDLSLTSTSGIVDNIKVESNKVHGVDAKIQLDLGNNINAKVHANIESITIDEAVDGSTEHPVQSHEGKEGVNAAANIAYALQNIVDNFNFDFSDKLLIDAALKIAKVSYKGQDISNIAILANGKDGVIQINKLEANIPGDSHFVLQGNISHNKIRPKLEGKLSFISNDLQSLSKWLDPESGLKSKSLGFSSDILFTPHHMSLSNIDASVDNMLFKGGLNIYHNTKTQMSVNSTIELDNIDANAFGLDQMVDEQIFNLFVSDYDRSGEMFSKATSDLRWLRRFPINWSCDLDLSNLKFKDYRFDRLFLSFSVESNQLLISRINIDSNLAKLNGALNLTLPTFRPLLEGELNFDYLDQDVFTKLLPNFTTLRGQLQDYTKKNGPPKGYFDTDFNFFSCGQYDSALQFSALYWKIGQDELKNVKGSITTGNGTLDLTKLTAQAFGGDINLNFNFTVTNVVPSFSASFAVNNINPKRLFSVLTGADKIDGYLSTRGNISTAAQTIDGMYQKLSGESNIEGRKMSWQGFSIGDIIATTESLGATSDKVKQLNYYMNSGTSSFDNITGSIKINNGIADLNNFTLKNSRSTGILVAKYDISSTQLNSISKFSFIPTGETGALTFQMRNKGTVSKSEVELDFDSISKYLTTHSRDLQDQTSVESLLQGRRQD